MTTQRQARGAIWAEKTITRKTKTTLSTPVSLVNKSNKITSKRTTLGTPGVLKQVGFKNGVFNGHNASGQNREGRSKINKTKIKPPSQIILTTRLTGTFVLFLRQYYPSPFFTGAPKINSRKSPKMDVCPLS